MCFIFSLRVLPYKAELARQTGNTFVCVFQPPVIRLCDLMVRTNAAVKSGVQLLLLESSSPEMYKLDFTDKKKAKE